MQQTTSIVLYHKLGNRYDNAFERILSLVGRILNLEKNVVEK